MLTQTVTFRNEPSVRKAGKHVGVDAEGISLYMELKQRKCAQASEKLGVLKIHPFKIGVLISVLALWLPTQQKKWRKS